MKNSLQSVRKHKFVNILEDLGNSDITYNISFYLLKRILKKYATNKINIDSFISSPYLRQVSPEDNEMGENLNFGYRR